MGLQLLVEDVMLHRAPAGAAVFLRPVRNAPALLVEDAPPGDHLVLGEMPALDQLLARLCRNVVAEKRTHLFTKRHLVLGESQIHGILLLSISSSSRRKPGPITTGLRKK